MSRNSIPLLLAVLLTGACASSPRPQPRPAPLAVPTTLARAQACLLQGQELLGKNDLAGAQESFDQALDLLLDAGGDLSDRPALINEYIEKISSIELDYLKDKGSKESEQQDAFLDEVIAAPLFSASEQDVREVQQKLAAGPTLTYSIPVVINPQVVSFIKAFQTIKHDGIQNALNRGAGYLDAFKEIFRRNQLPEDLAYLPIIESGFRATAASRARARGMWQFVAATARLFGLQVDWLVDERLDPYKAAEGAARYLRFLYDQYGDWYIVLACYNGGPRRVVRAMNVHQARDFFEINQSRLMKRETRNYVPAFLASLIIAKSPQDYNFAVSPEPSLFDRSKTVNLPSPVSLSQVAGLLRVPYEELKQLNPELISDYTPPSISRYGLRIPKEADEAALAGLTPIPGTRSAATWSTGCGRATASFPFPANSAYRWSGCARSTA